MCGRFTLSSPADVIADWFHIVVPDDCMPRYNIAPTQTVLTIDAGEEDRAARPRRWGLIPSWARDPDIGQRMINARSETAAEKPSFRKALEKRRCLIPASGFYEWKKQDDGKQPYLIRMSQDPVFAFAGLWERWKSPDDQPLETCTILTTEANEVMKSLHHRIPVILHPKSYDTLLSPEPVPEEIRETLFKPFAESSLRAHPVSRHVNSPRNDDPTCEVPVVDKDTDPSDDSEKEDPDEHQGLLF